MKQSGTQKVAYYDIDSSVINLYKMDLRIGYDNEFRIIENIELLNEIKQS